MNQMNVLEINKIKKFKKGVGIALKIRKQV